MEKQTNKRQIKRKEELLAENVEIEETVDEIDIEEIRVYAKEVKTNDGKSFIAYNVVKKYPKKNTFTSLRFTQDAAADCEIKQPKKQGYYLFRIETKALSLQVKHLENGVEQKILWIRDGFGVHSIKPDINYAKEMEKKREEALKNELNEEDELPF